MWYYDCLLTSFNEYEKIYFEDQNIVKSVNTQHSGQLSQFCNSDRNNVCLKYHSLQAILTQRCPSLKSEQSHPYKHKALFKEILYQLSFVLQLVKS